VRTDQDAASRENTRVGQAAENAGRGGISCAGPAGAELCRDPRNAGNVGRERGVFLLEARRQPIERRRFSAQIELPCLPARK
jgi:hypothetical protein